MNDAFFLTWLGSIIGGVNGTGLVLLLIWGIRYNFVYRGAQPAGEGHPETNELKQVLVIEDRRPFSFWGGLGKHDYRAAMLFYLAASMVLPAAFLQFVPSGMSLGHYLVSTWPSPVGFLWWFLFILLNVFQWSVVTRRLRATTKSPWGMVATAWCPPLYLVNAIALGQGSDGVLDKGE